ncbi:MAG: hypothetical protein H6838_00865 [Planctomycetes bacterium]|nr:hypothetical protein [Planctomycetota bacterium]MCB9884006.1 hypothetical protein [Planctomycetota bacterium]
MRPASSVILLSVLGAAQLTPAPLAAQNPLARKAPAPTADPWSRLFRGEELSLQLQAGESGHVGTLRQGEAAFPVTARATSATRLAGTFRVGDEQFGFTCELDGDTLTLVSDGASYTLRAAPVAPRNPLAKAGKAVVPDLADVHTGPAVTLRHPDGIFTTEAPKGWSVARTQDDVMLINPGLQEGGTLDAIVLVTWGELDEEDRGQDLTRLFRSSEAELLKGLTDQGIAVRGDDSPPRKVAVGDRAGVEKSWAGTASGTKVKVWTGALVEREYYLAVIAIVVDGKERDFLPGARRLFRSLQPKAPERNRAAEASLAGATFASGNQAGGGGAFHTIYEFGADGAVKKQMLMSGSVGGGIDVGGDSEEHGRYRVVGQVLYVQLRSGQQVGRIEVDGDRVGAIRFGEARYARR